MKKQIETKAEPKTDVKMDLAEIKVTLEIMKKEIDKLETKLKAEREEYNKAAREMFEMRNNRG